MADTNDGKFLTNNNMGNPVDSRKDGAGVTVEPMAPAPGCDELVPLSKGVGVTVVPAQAISISRSGPPVTVPAPKPKKGSGGP